MHEIIRATGPSRSRSELPTSEAWHDLSRYVAQSRSLAPSARQSVSEQAEDTGDRGS